MAQPSCKVFLAKVSSAWYQPSGAQQRVRLGQVNGALAQVGGKSIITFGSG